MCCLVVVAVVGQDIVDTLGRDWAPCIVVAPYWAARRSCVALTSVCWEEWGRMAVAITVGQNESRVNSRAHVTLKHYSDEFPIQ
jgi:hypothetical protein